MKAKDKRNPTLDKRDRSNDKCASISRRTWLQTQFAQNLTGKSRKEIYAEAVDNWLRKMGIHAQVAKLVSEREKREDGVEWRGASGKNP